MKRKRNRIPEAECYKMVLVEWTAKALPITPEMKMEPRIGRPARPKPEANGEKPARSRRKKKSD